MYAIETYSLTKKFNDFVALDKIDLRIPEGKFISILGPNGAGKTTLLEILEGLQKPTDGFVKILGKEWNKENEIYLKKKIGLCLQETRFIEQLTVLEILKLFGTFYDVSKKRIKEVIDLLGLYEKRNTYIKFLSGGQKQKLALAISIIHEPNILFLDEPTTGLDPEARKNLWDFLIQLKQKNKTIILTTHYMEEAEYLSDYIYLINHGKIIADGTLKSLIKNYGDFIKIKIQYESYNSKEGVKLENITNKINKNILQYYMDQKNKIIVFMMKNINLDDNILKNILTLLKKNKLNIRDIEIHRPDLNDIFLKITGETISL